MKILSFDTSNAHTSVAISNGQNMLAYFEDLKAYVQAERLLPMIEAALKTANLSYNDIQYLGITNGPGSFTGIRVGLAAAKGIVLSTKIRAVVVSNLEVLHFRVLSQIRNYDKVIILSNACRGQFYAQCFYNKNNTLSFDEPSIIDIDVAIRLLALDNASIIACAGSGVELIYNTIKDLSHVIILPRITKVKALHICRYINNIISIYESRPIEPLYIRPPYC